jgi:hypothetical protein
MRKAFDFFARGRGAIVRISTVSVKARPNSDDNRSDFRRDYSREAIRTSPRLRIPRHFDH